METYTPLVSKTSANQDHGGEAFAGHEETDIASLTERNEGYPSHLVYPSCGGRSKALTTLCQLSKTDYLSSHLSESRAGQLGSMSLTCEDKIDCKSEAGERHLLWSGTVDTFKTLSIERSGPGNLCETYILSLIPRSSWDAGISLRVLYNDNTSFEDGEATPLRWIIVDPSDNERAETPSLPSNPGRERRGGKRKSKTGANVTRRRITLFGFDLFGRPPPIQLPDDNDDAPLFRRHSSGGRSTPTATYTFDSDAAPLPTIQSISMSKASEAANAEAKRKEERRQRRNEMKGLVLAMGRSLKGFRGVWCWGWWGDDGYVFVGVSLSFAISLPIPANERRLRGLRIRPPPIAAEQDDEDADLDGSLYARKKSKSTNGVHSIGGTSDSRRNRSSLSRTSAFVSDRAQQHISQATLPVIGKLPLGALIRPPAYRMAGSSSSKSKTVLGLTISASLTVYAGEEGDTREGDWEEVFDFDLD
ncbi:uncharacterized protein LACBIDRAFT_333476 [Laccaria bicolor S238N-H82]|uniref:Predicted protein n=1 Tax=Laccaria bicolor (strain S238N-H82 / ATCC MYA-4686) TaxID=486041 RepID=B0DW18_LACBS|nr:uncharacterized protein LACBIDRAFT_333476 [Laccaria bicolor S238N-H82]EDR01268.1 predicted protein [Laccaria bicolor S238N-H82]|eukprot:XP_001888144.1 predicted protein [Laccaria bicolor S238N-H82]